MNFFKETLKNKDKLIYKLLKKEKRRQKEKLILNAATSITPRSILEIQGSIFDNIDAEGYIPKYIKYQSIEELENIDRQIELYRKYKDNRCNKCCEYANIIEALAQKRLARMLIAGASSFPLNIDWQRLKKLINSNSANTLLMADIARTAGLVAGKVFNNPVGVADVTTLVTYKTFCGPRAAAIISTNAEISKQIDETVFPKIMGSPLLLGIVAIAVASNIALTDKYKKMQKQIVENSRFLCNELLKLDIPVVYKTSDTHIVLLDCSEYGSGQVVANILEDCNILVNYCLVPSINGYHEGIRIGTTCITQRNISKKKIKKIAMIIADVLTNLKNKEEIDYIKIKEKVKKINIGR